MKKIILSCLFFLTVQQLLAFRNPDSIYMSNIKSVKFFQQGNQTAYPIMPINGSERLELHFDDLDGGVKYYSYNIQLCNADWTPAYLSQFQYTRGFNQVRINTYRFSSISYTRYTHYEAILPDNNLVPTMSGNYILKVFMDGDTSKIAFTKRFLVVDNKVKIAASVVQPYNPRQFQTHQKIQFTMDVSGLRANNAATQVKVSVLQNNRWDNAAIGIPPTFVRGNQLEYSSENQLVFEAGREWRWLNMESLTLQGARVEKTEYNSNATTVYVRKDFDRQNERFNFLQDYNGGWVEANSDGYNPYWQSDYATVVFSYVPPGNNPYSNTDVYLFGELTQYSLTDSFKMNFNPEKGLYETKQFLKQGYYNYGYMLYDRITREHSSSLTEGNYWETENTYTLLVYYRAFGARSDELIGVAYVNSGRYNQ